VATTACVYEANALYRGHHQSSILFVNCSVIDIAFNGMDLIDSSYSSLNIRINYHPMNLLSSIASIADLFTRPLPTISHHRYTQLVIGDVPITPTPLSASAHSTATVDSATVAPTSTITVNSLATVIASVPTAVPTSDSVALPIVFDAGAPYPRTPFASDFALKVTQAPYGLIRSALSVASKAHTSKLASTPVDPYTLITGEDVSVSFDSDPIDLSSTDPTLASNSVEPFEFGTAILTFIYYKSTSELLHIFVEPTQIDWLHWVPLPRLILPESYYHIFGLDYLQAFTLFHLIPIWIYCLLHFAVNLN